MKSFIVFAVALFATSLNGQTVRRQATFNLGGEGDRGRCVVEIVVDGAAEIALRADDATVTNLKGQMPEIRRFECSARIPGNPADFRYAPVSGRGKQELVRPAGGDAPAVVRIEDPQNGAGVYVFELGWRAEGRREGDRPGFGDAIRGAIHRFTTDEAVDACRREVRNRLADRFRPDDIIFREIRIDDAPGRGEWVIGSIEAVRDGRHLEPVRFSCSVNFETGAIRSAEIEAFREPRRRITTDEAMDACRREVRNRLADRFRSEEINFREIRIDDAPGRGEWIVGRVEAGRRGEPMRFACSVNFETGAVRSAEVNPAR